MNNKKLSYLIKKTLASRDDETVNAILGDYNGVVLTGKPYQVYARVGNAVVKAQNYIAPNNLDLRVKIGRINEQGFCQVVSFRDAYNEPATPNIPDHNDLHRYLPVYRDQIVNLNGYPISGTLSIQIMGSDIVVDNAWITVPSTLFDLTASLPTAGARWVLFQFHSTTGIITTVDGSLVDSKEILTNANIPAPSASNIPFLAGRMYDNQIEFSYLKDFVRPLHIIGSTGGGGVDYLDELLDVEINYPTDGQVLTYDAYAELWINSSLDVIFAPISEPIAAAHISDATDAHDASAISAANAGGYFTGTDVEAQLQELGVKKVVAENNASEIFYITSPGGVSAFAGTIATLPGGATLTYNVVSGQEGAMVPASTANLAKVILYNTTRGTSALISNCVAGTNTLTLTANVPAGWQVGDTINITSSYVSGTFSWIDLKITSGIVGKPALFIAFRITSATVGDAIRITTADGVFVGSKTQLVLAQVANVQSNNFGLLKLTSNIFSIAWTGTPTDVVVREMGYQG